MKRAIVWKGPETGRWWASACPAEQYQRTRDIHFRVPYGFSDRSFPTHAAALAHALAEVGLDRPAEHREAP